MISCTEFIPAYSELFKFLESRGGKNAVLDYWKFISDKGLDTLRNYVIENGIGGCFMYWSHTLNEEAADFTMTLDKEEDTFEIEMHYCPSKGRLIELKHLSPYRDYCEHCDIIFRRVFEPLGYEYDYDMSQCDKARCHLIVKGKRG